MQCPKCGYVMGPFDTECERCKRGYQKPLPPTISSESKEPLQQAAEAEAAPSKEEPTATQARAIRARSVRNVLTGLVVLSIGAVSAFVWTEQRRTDAAEHKATEAMLDLQAAVTVGVSYLTYADYVIKAKQLVLQAKREAPMLRTYTAFWSEVEAALDDYQFAEEAWTWKLFGDDFTNDQDRCSAIKQRYPDFQLIPVPAETFGDMTFPAHWSADIDSVLQAAWASADTHMLRAQAHVNR